MEGGEGAGAVRLRAEAITAGYGPLPVVRDVDLAVNAGEVVGLLGANGAGKTTTLLALCGELPLMSGTVTINGRPTTAPLWRRARGGLAFVSEERSVFTGLTCEENLMLGQGSVQAALRLMPELKPLLKRKAGLLSGGEQQMVTLARALAAEPAVLLIDEVSLGLAPMIVDRLLSAVRAAAESGIAALVVEQHAQRALSICDRAYVMHRGEIALAGDAGELLTRLAEIEGSYLTHRIED
jgi:branched-chain amino acid transport system ATP-binding protein